MVLLLLIVTYLVLIDTEVIHWKWYLVAQPSPLAWMSGSDTAITGNLWRGFGMSEVAKFRWGDQQHRAWQRFMEKIKALWEFSVLLINSFNMGQLLYYPFCRRELEEFKSEENLRIFYGCIMWTKWIKWLRWSWLIRYLNFLVCKTC